MRCQSAAAAEWPQTSAEAIIDTAMFKPVFVPCAERETQKQNNNKQDGRGKDKKRARAIVLLNDEEEDDRGMAALVIAPQKRADKDKNKVCRKKKYHKEEEGEEEDADMWVEKALPQVVASFDSAWLAVTVLLLCRIASDLETVEGDLVSDEGGGRRVATQAYPKIRAEVLIRHKRLYLGGTGKNSYAI